MPVVPHQMSGEFDQDGEQGVALETRTKTKRPPLYKVLLLNDDYTPMEFVVVVLELSLIHISSPRDKTVSRMPSSA